MDISRTSQAVALTRAGLGRPHSPDGDPAAQRTLCAGMTFNPPAWLRPGIEARTRFVDQQVLAAIAAGVRQVAICGAGYDDRALRFRSDGVRFFELDHPGTQADKLQRLQAIARRAPTGPDKLSGLSHSVGLRESAGLGKRAGLSRLGVTLAAVDFRTDEVAAVLEACGHELDLPTLFVCEGLLVYLDQTACRRLLSGLAARAAAGSVLAATLAIHADGLDSAEVVSAANARRRTGDAEPWRTILPTGEHLRMVEKAGWIITGSTDSPVPSADVSDGRRSILVTASPAL
ncbi:MAG: class I SAM-dependent methyltransferase [Streptosporangiaceae bacterium]